MKKAEPDVDSLFNVLSHPIRRKIILTLGSYHELSYTDMVREIGVDEGQLNFHLRRMRGFISNTSSGTYTLSTSGTLAKEIINIAELRFKTKEILMEKNMLIKRVLAFLIDIVIILLVTGLFMDVRFWQIIQHIILLHIPDLQRHVYDIITGYSQLIMVSYLIFTILEGYKGQTLGKYAVRIRVVKETGERLRFLEVAVRNIGKVFLLPIDLAIGLFYFKKGYIKFFDYYVNAKVIKA